MYNNFVIIGLCAKLIFDTDTQTCIKILWAKFITAIMMYVFLGSRQEFMVKYFIFLAVSSNPVSMASTVSNGCTLLPSNSGPPRLSVTPRVSGLERSQERSLELPYPEATSTSSSLLLPRSPASVSTSLAEQNGNAAPHHRHDCSPPQHKLKSFLSFTGRSQAVYGTGSNNRWVKFSAELLL